MRLIDEVTNLSDAAKTGEMELIYHTNFGPPLLEPGSRVVAPVRRMMPRDAAAVPGVGHWDQFGEPTTGPGEECYFFQLLSGSDNRTPPRCCAMRPAIAALACDIHRSNAVRLLHAAGKT